MLKYTGKGSSLVIEFALPHRNLTEAEVRVLLSLSPQNTRQSLTSAGVYKDMKKV